MSKSFTGMWATYEYLDDLCSAVSELRRAGFSHLTTHAPCPRHEIDHALGDPQSRVPFGTLVGMLCGFALAVSIMIGMSMEWFIPVSGKPIVGVPIMGPVAFELSVLTAIYFTIFTMIALIIRDTLKHPMPKSKEYKNYNRFMRDRFGVVVPCTKEEYSQAETIIKRYQAEEVYCED